MHINVWGPSLWELIHTIAFKYENRPLTDELKRQYIIFFKSLTVLIPCNLCRIHYKYHISKIPVDKQVNSYPTLLKWVNDLHNIVNRRTRKKVYTIEEAKKKYFNNNTLLIDHKKIYSFIDNCVNRINPNTIGQFKFFLISMKYIYPCDICKKNLIIKLEKKKIETININNIKKIYKDIDIKKLHY